MQVAPLDSLAHLPGPPVKGNHGAAAMHAGQLLAYAAASAVVIVDAQRLTIATTLAGAHRQAAVSSLAWHPGGGPREPRAAAQLRLASGDDDGRVMVWNVNTGAVIAALEDPWASAFGTAAGAKRPEGGGGGGGGSVYRPPVIGLAWCTASPSVLAVLLAPCMLLLWDYRTGSILWRKEFGGGEPATGLAVDPLDRRRLVLCCARGTFIVLCLINPAADRIKQQQYQVDLGGGTGGGTGGTLRCAFSRTQDLLFLLLQREIIVFDLEYGQPAASTQLAGSRAPLEDLLGCFGHAAAGKSMYEGGIDLLYCSHKDGSLSVWQRHASLLTFSCLGANRLVPQAHKFGAAPSLLALSAGLWRGLDTASAHSLPADQDEPRARSSSSSGGPDAGSPGQALGSGWSGGDGTVSLAAGAQQALQQVAAREQQAQREAAGHSVLVMGVATDGRVWQWQLPLLTGTLRDPKLTAAAAAVPAASAAVPPQAPKPELLGLLHTLPHRITTFSVCPAPVALPGTAGGAAIAAVAAATAAGSIEIVAVQQGALLPLHLSISASLAAHSSAIQSLRWLGCTARLVSHSSEKVAQGYKNVLLITDVRNRVSLPFREGVAADPAPLTGLRASPSGRHLLVVFRGAPSEIWSVGSGSQPTRLRQVDLQFAAVEWLPSLPPGVTADMGPLAASAAAASAAAIGGGGGGSTADTAAAVYCSGCNPWQASPRAAEAAAGGYAVRPQPIAEEAPEERLAFALLDGKVGVLGIRGRRISDTRPRRPAWQALAAGDFRAVAIGSWGQSVLLGDSEGTLAHWDTVSGKCSVMDTGYGRIHRVYTSPPPAEALYPRLPGTAAVQARVAVLFASGLFSAYDLDQAGELWATHTTGSAAAARVGRVTDVAWLPLPPPVGGGAVLVASLADGSMGLFDTVHSIDVRPRRARMQRYREALHTPPPPPQPVAAVAAAAPPLWGLLAAPPAAAAPLLPRSWGLLLRLLLQRGVPVAAFQELGSLAASIGGGGTAAAVPQSGTSAMDAEVALERLEAEIWAHLPRSCHAAWLSLLAHRAAGGSGGDEAASPALMQLVESFGAGSDDEADGGGGGWDAAAAHGQSQSHSSGAVHERSASRDEAAAAALGLTGRAASASGAASAPGGGAGRKRDNVAQTLKGLGGAVKSQLKSLTASAGRGQQPLVAAVAGISDGYEYGQLRAGFTSLVEVLHAIATARGQPAVLSPAELAAYGQALSSRRVADRMALAAQLSGDEAEATFWRRLPATLDWLAAALAAAAPRPRPSSAAAAALSGSSGGTRGGDERRLWDEGLQLQEGAERSGWHEQMSRRLFEGSEDLQEKRVLEYVSLGDYQTAVGFLLASPPDRSTRYYRDALCTLGMAFACGLQSQAAAQPGGGSAAALQQQQQAAASGPSAQAGSSAADPWAASAPAGAAAAAEDSAARTLFVQAAKVITANAAAVGDTLLGVPLLCSTGQFADATALLQDGGLWRYAAVLMAHSLRGSERAAPMERWATHAAAAEGRPWVAAGLLVAAGALSSALLLLREHGLPDAAAALTAACKEAELPLLADGDGGGELGNVFGGAGLTPRFDSAGARLPDQRRSSTDGRGGAVLQRSVTLTDYERSEAAKQFQLYACELLQQL
ncbi:hypothetical protein D9Q98_008096 [Chlorella vulgaris]|uniref:Uncharacterized protein n=1 Tax=Chlorella vulgaris TaxID=3077 RepID=A0A9D4TFZ5_CHLVU|nr:hypothetical protein D9Q98_008096 [Chlorella vulgaris]